MSMMLTFAVPEVTPVMERDSNYIQFEIRNSERRGKDSRLIQTFEIC